MTENFELIPGNFFGTSASLYDRVRSAGNSKKCQAKISSGKSFSRKFLAGEDTNISKLMFPQKPLEVISVLRVGTCQPL